MVPAIRRGLLSLRWPRLALLAAAACAAVTPAFARDLTAEERAALTRTVDGFATAMHDGDEARVTAILPPRMLAWLASTNAVDVTTLRQSIQKTLQAAYDAGIRETETFDLAHAAFASLKDGTPYVVIPTHIVAEGPRHVDARFDTLALMEGGTWYLLDIGNETKLERLRKAYPEFEGVTFGNAPQTKP